MRTVCHLGDDKFLPNLMNTASVSSRFIPEVDELKSSSSSFNDVKLLKGSCEDTRVSSFTIKSRSPHRVVDFRFGRSCQGNTANLFRCNKKYLN